MNKKRIGKWKAQKRPDEPIIYPEAFEYARQLREALEQTEGIPIRDRWSMALAVLSNEMLEAMTFPSPTIDDVLDYYAPLILVMTLEWLGEAPTQETAAIALLILRMSFAAEMEKRRKLYTTDVIHVTNPFYFNPEQPIEFVPKDPATFDQDVMFRHYFHIGESEAEQETTAATHAAADSS